MPTKVKQPTKTVNAAVADLDATLEVSEAYSTIKVLRKSMRKLDKHRNRLAKLQMKFDNSANDGTIEMKIEKVQRKISKHHDRIVSALATIGDAEETLHNGR